MAIRNSKIDYQQKQLTSYASLLQKITQKQPIRIVCQGDSMTYGQDTFSNDRRPPKSDPTCEEQSSYSTHEQAGTTYPEALQQYLNQLYDATIINRGYSGDWAEVSKKRWIINPDADLHLVMLGTNDSSTANHVQKDVQQNIIKYTEDMSKLIEQILDFPSAVILLTPPKHSNESDMMRIIYRKVLQQVGALYHIPVIDTTDFLKGIPFSEVQCDNVHYNSYGYSIMAAKIAGILSDIHNMYDPFYVQQSQIIEPSLSYTGILIKDKNPPILEENEQAPFGLGSMTKKGLSLVIPPQSRLLVSFYTTVDNLNISPRISQRVASLNLNLALDFGIKEESIKVTDHDSHHSNICFNLATKGPYSILIENQGSDYVGLDGFTVTQSNQ